MAKMVKLGRQYVVLQASPSDRRKLVEMGWLWHPAPCVFSGCPICAAKVPTGSWYGDNRVRAYVLSKLPGMVTSPGLFADMERSEARSSATAPSSPAAVEPKPQTWSQLSLYPFQSVGVDWIVEHKHTLLADEMGTGKTIQILAAINRINPRRAAVVVPASLRTNWLREAQKWLRPSIQAKVARRPEEVDWDSARLHIIGYEGLTAGGGGKRDLAETLGTLDFLAFDESSKIKNPKAKRTKAALRVAKRARKVVFANGTPVMNHAAELWTTLSIICPDYVGSFFKFRERFCHEEKTSFWRNSRRVVKKSFKGVKHYDELNALLRGGGFMLRRKKMDVLTQLPPKIRQMIMLDVDNNILEKAQQEGRVFDELEQLKAQRLSGDIGLEYRLTASTLQEQINAKAGELAKVRRELGMEKLPLIQSFVEDLLDGARKVVLFFHHRGVGDALHEAFDSSVLYYGGMSDRAKQEAVDRFQSGDARLFLGSISSAGVGLTLTSASHVVLAELDWVPAMVIQAEDRCHRNGQKSVVNVYHLVVDGSIDARIAKRIISKADTAHRILDDDLVRLIREA